MPPGVVVLGRTVVMVDRVGGSVGRVVGPAVVVVVPEVVVVVVLSGTSWYSTQFIMKSMVEEQLHL